MREVSAAVGSTTREAVTRMYGRNKGFLGATSTTARLEERPLLSETEARTMDPDEVIILASPQHPIRAKRIKYFEDPFFADLAGRQAGRDFPYPPHVQGVGPWQEDLDSDASAADPGHAMDAPTIERARRRQSRSMLSSGNDRFATEPRPETLDRDDPAPEKWQKVFREQGDFIDELLGDQ